MANKNVTVMQNFIRGQPTDLLFPNSVTVEGFAPCGLFYTPIHQMTLFFPLCIARHSRTFPSAADVEKL